ncbi:nucleoside phosphorylase [Kutzneria viridogrisea]|nr:hypothetical protein [Kutzneria albida]MBA8927767.1 nucleoside phosphorylase [Kutzneria viridogrisea]
MDPQWQPTVGLLTATPEEFAAMRAFLDSVVELRVAEDPATYVLGALPSWDCGRRHNVVLTLLGSTANSAAANGCANLARSFPTVELTIMVGIAAGIPNPVRHEQHVRRGDIVVATRGVVDYDHVRVVGGDTELRRAFSLPSPRLVRCADMLQADELVGDRRPWENLLDLSVRPELAKYSRPPTRSDILLDSSGARLRHPSRSRSGHREGFPKVHYGSIGSADRSLRDVAVRDELAKRYGFLAVEMEGSGIGSSSTLNGLEWFVVRGISDYGDTHRDHAWRRYAALAAAAYVRSLLGKCTPIRL